MPIGRKFTRRNLADTTAELPGVPRDIVAENSEPDKKNRELAKRVKQLAIDLKPSDGGQPRFLLGWRLLPNADNPYWNQPGADQSASCGCGCGCPVKPDYPPPPPDPNDNP
jgi:hypothetical protein